MTCHVTCQKYQFYFNMFRTLKPSCVLNLVPSYTLRNITNKLFSPVKASVLGLKLLEKPVIRAARLICAFSVDKLITEHLPNICILFIFFSLDQFQPIQISAELRRLAIDDFSSLFAAIGYSLFGFRDTPMGHCVMAGESQKN